MNRFKKTILLFLALPLVGCAEADVAHLLEAYQWKNRVLVLLVHEADNEALSGLYRQIEAISDEWKERDLKTLIVVKDSFVAVDDARMPHLPTAPFFEYFESQEDAFTMILIGKDGLEKYRDTEAISAECVLAIIDAMPMRQSEINKI